MKTTNENHQTTATTINIATAIITTIADGHQRE